MSSASSNSTSYPRRMNVVSSRCQSYARPSLTLSYYDLPAFTRALLRAIIEDELSIAYCPPLFQENYRCRIDPETRELRRIVPGSGSDSNDAATAPIIVPTIIISLPSGRSTKKSWKRCVKVLQGKVRRETWEGWNAYPPLSKGSSRRFAVEFRQEAWVGKKREKGRTRGKGDNGGEWRLETKWFCPQKIKVPGRRSRNVALRGNHVGIF